MLLKREQPTLWANLTDIQRSLDLDDTLFSELLQLTEKEFMGHRYRKSDLPVTRTMSLTETLNISFDALVLGDYDLKALVGQFYDGEDVLPEKYAVRTLSVRRMSLAMLDFVEHKFGWQKRALLLRKLQMNESMYLDLNAPISGEIGYDILTLMTNNHQNTDIVRELGEHSFHTHKHTEIGVGLSFARSGSEAYEIAMSEVIPKYFNKYETWRLVRAGFDSCEVSTVPNISALLDLEVNVPHFANSTICKLNEGYLRTFTDYAGLPPVRVVKRACVNSGASECRYEIFFSRTRPTIRQLQ